MEKSNVRAMNRTKRNMRTRRNLSRIKDYMPQAVAAFLVLAAILLLLFILLKLPVIGSLIASIVRALAPALAGFIFAFIMSPMVRFLETRLMRLHSKHATEGEESEKTARVRKRARYLSIVITLVFVLAVIAFLLVTIIPELAKSLKNLLLNLADYLRQLWDYIDHYLDRNPRVADIIGPLRDKLSDTENIAKKVQEHLSFNTASVTFTFAWNSARMIVRILYVWLVGTIVAVYLLASKEYYIGLCKKLFFAILPKRTSKNAIQTLHKANIIYSAAILGKLLDSIIIGLICFIGTSILGIWFSAIGEYKVLVSVVVGVTNVIPFFGPFLGGIPCAILIVSMNPLHGLVFALFIVALQQFDGNFLDPHIVGKKVGLRPLYVLCACMLCGGLFGIPGLIVATPTCALVYYLVKSYLEVRLESKNLPTETSDYVMNPSAVIANRSMSVDLLTERLVAESDALDAAQAEEIEKEIADSEEGAAKRRRRRHRSGRVGDLLEPKSVMDSAEGSDLDLSAYDDLESGVARERRLEMAWLMSGGEEDANDNGIADDFERAHLEEKVPEPEPPKKKVGFGGIVRRMIEEAEEDWNEHGNKPLPGSKKESEGEEKPADDAGAKDDENSL